MLSVMENVFPSIIKIIPVVDYGIDGLEARMTHTKEGTMWFVHAAKEVNFPEHCHAEQWTVVISGSATLRMNGKCMTYKEGDTYIIPAGVKHSITLHAGYREVDYVDDPLDGEAQEA